MFLIEPESLLFEFNPHYLYTIVSNYKKKGIVKDKIMYIMCTSRLYSRVLNCHRNHKICTRECSVFNASQRTGATSQGLAEPFIAQEAIEEVLAQPGIKLVFIELY